MNECLWCVDCSLDQAHCVRILQLLNSVLKINSSLFAFPPRQDLEPEDWIDGVPEAFQLLHRVHPGHRGVRVVRIDTVNPSFHC